VVDSTNTDTEVDPFKAADAALDAEFKNAEESQPDPVDLYGVDSIDDGLESSDEPDVEPDTDSVEYWKAQAKKEKVRAQRAETNSRLREAVVSINEKYPNAYKPSIDRAIRLGRSIETIEGIAKASHSDVERGRALGQREALSKSKAIISDLKKRLEESNVSNAKNAWGKPIGVAKGDGAPSDIGDILLARTRKTHPGNLLK